MMDAPVIVVQYREGKLLIVVHCGEGKLASDWLNRY
jgi:hypothetical protein